VDENITMESDYVQRNKGGDQKQGKIGEWLEDRVAEFKKAQDSRCDVERKEDLDGFKRDEVGEENVGEEERCDTMGSPSMLSTRGDTFDRRLSLDSGSRVDIAQQEQEDKGSCDDNADPDNNYQMAEHQSIADHRNSQGSPPDETEINQVWEKANEKQQEQETFVNQFEDYCESKDNSGNGNDLNHSTKDAEPEIFTIQQQNFNPHGNPNGEPSGYDDNEWDQNSNGVKQEELYEYQGNVDESSNVHGLPPGWEAILDPASGDYYYTNWDTGEVTWDHPLEPVHDHPDDQYSLGEGEVNVIAEDGTLDGSHAQNEGLKSEGHACDNYCMDSDATSPPSDVAATLHADHDPSAAAQHDSSDETPPLVKYEPRCHSNFMENDEKNCDFADIDASDCDSSAYLFDDQSSASSAIGALARWNQPVSPNSGRSSDSNILGKASNHSGSSKDDMEGWSDEEGEGISTSGENKLERSQNSLSQKKQPWHKDSETENNDSFFFRLNSSNR